MVIAVSETYATSAWVVEMSVDEIVVAEVTQARRERMVAPRRLLDRDSFMLIFLGFLSSLVMVFVLTILRHQYQNTLVEIL